MCLIIPTKPRGLTHRTTGRGVVRQQQVDKCIMNVLQYQGSRTGRTVECAIQGERRPNSRNISTIPISCSQPIIGNPYYPQLSSYPYLIQAYNQHDDIIVEGDNENYYPLRYETDHVCTALFGDHYGSLRAAIRLDLTASFWLGGHCRFNCARSFLTTSCRDTASFVPPYSWTTALTLAL